MSEDIRIWKIEDSSKAVSPLEPADRMETEHALEELLVASPGMLMPGLVLIGRQTPIDGGALDLLGVDEDGRLVVFELKREKPTREAVAQVLDYCSHLDRPHHIVVRSRGRALESLGNTLAPHWRGHRWRRPPVSGRTLACALPEREASDCGSA